MELNFYHVMSGNLVPSVAKLLEKVYDSGKKSVFFSPLEDRVKIVDKTLWTFSKNAFIPHGDKSLGFSELQSVYLTSEIENPNKATVLVMTDDFDYKSWNQNFERVICIFEDDDSAEIAQSMFSDLKNQGENVKYWKQSQKGWEKLG
ncbi:MAG: DNA polymerase III subunit chi [Alphaproteobacteria bacterium]|nr:DNA polymerase III subunit chi [Alphaproteobacteria bacterium]MBO7537599.1 DNA polymerase III subunit chi [Alphaproteobacteria bacterium]